MQPKRTVTLHFDAPKQLKLTPEQQRMEKLWGQLSDTDDVVKTYDWDDFPEDDQ